jgi:GWxTD domain-containing protein
MRRFTCLILFALYAGLTAPAVSDAENPGVYAVPRGEPRVLMTEIWTAQSDGSDPKWIKTFPGEPGDLLFSSKTKTVIYLERGLRQAAFGGHLVGGHTIPIVGSRVWRFRLDGSEETPWPLPEELHAEMIAVSPDGEKLVVSGSRGSLLSEGKPGLWIVDVNGNSKQLMSYRAGGPLRWSGDGLRVYFSYGSDSNSRSIEITSGEVSQEGQKSALPVVVEKPKIHTRERREEMNRVLSRIGGMGLGRYGMGHYGSHRGEYPKARDMFRDVKDVFKSLSKGSYRVAKGSCKDYVDEMNRLIRMNDKQRRERICREHMAVLHRIIAQYVAAHDGQLPPGLMDVLSWKAEAIESETVLQQELTRNRAVLEDLFYCPAISESDPLIGYIFDLNTLPGSPQLACLWHRGRYLRLDDREGVRTSADNLESFIVDSLIVAGDRSIDSDKPEMTAALFQLVAHQRHKDEDVHIRLGHIFLRGKDYERAKRTFERAIYLGGGARAHYGLGLVYAELPKDRYMALRHFREALVKDRGFVDARFQMGRVRYLMGERDAEGELQRVLEMDPNYADAYLLMGDWYANYWEDFERAIVWYTRYIALRPNDPEVRSRLGATYLKVKAFGRILDSLLEFIQDHPDAIELMPIVAQAGMKQGKLDMAMAFFQRYLSRLPPEERVLYEDIRLISSINETAEYQSTPEKDRKDFLKRFWNGRDPDLSTQINERLLEHYRRVWVARAEFSKRVRPWDTRGEVYIRFGEPDHRNRSDSPNFKMDLEVLQVKEALAAAIYGEDWTGETFIGPVHPVRSFNRLDENRHYVGKSEMEIAFTDTSKIPRIIESKKQEPGFSELVTFDNVLGFGHYHPMTSNGRYLSSVPWETWTYTNVAGGIEVTFTDEVGTGGFDYAPMPSTILDEMETRQAVRLLLNASQPTYERAVRVTPTHYVPEGQEEVLDFHYSIATFRGDEANSVIEIYFGIPSSAEHFIQDLNLTRHVLNRYAALIPVTLDTIYRDDANLSFDLAGNRTGPGDFLPDQVSLKVKPGAYRLEVKALDRARGRQGIYRQQVMVPEFGPDTLRISGLELAWKVTRGAGDPRFTKGDLTVIPLASRTYAVGQNIFVYYEIYNLERTAFGQTHYKVEYTVRPRTGATLGNVIARLIQTITGKKSEEIRVGYEQAGQAQSERAYVELEIPRREKGRHVLSVTVTDLVRSAGASEEVVFQIE